MVNVLSFGRALAAMRNRLRCLSWPRTDGSFCGSSAQRGANCRRGSSRRRWCRCGERFAFPAGQYLAFAQVARGDINVEGRIAQLYETALHAKGRRDPHATSVLFETKYLVGSRSFLGAGWVGGCGLLTPVIVKQYKLNHRGASGSRKGGRSPDLGPNGILGLMS